MVKEIIKYLEKQLENEEFSLNLSEESIKREQENVEVRLSNIETIQKALVNLSGEPV